MVVDITETKGSSLFIAFSFYQKRIYEMGWKRNKKTDLIEKR
jgi:hypothetical protein